MSTLRNGNDNGHEDTAEEATEDFETAVRRLKQI